MATQDDEPLAVSILLTRWINAGKPGVGLCLFCGEVIRSTQDLLLPKLQCRSSCVERLH